MASNGSAFGFINSGAPPTTAPAPPSFDPLKNSNNQMLTPNSAQKKAMQISPEQMQAMAYQQMMMQQQQMQMQMQYSMAMQQQMGGGMVPGGMPMYPPLGQGVARASSLGSPGAAPLQQFSFAPKPAKKDDKKFDFVKDAMHTAGHKK